MNKAIALLGGLGASVAAAYFLDPKKGASRRAMIRDKFKTFKDDASHKLNEMSEGLKPGSFGDDTKAIGDGGQRNQSQQSHQQSQQFKPGTPGHSTAM